MKLMSHRAVAALGCLGVLTSLVGCAPGAEGTDREAIGTAADAIINGTAMTAADEETWGMVRINNGSCSGALLRNQWVLTASHCFDGGLDNPGNYQITMNAQTVRADAIIPHSTYDVALVHLATPLSRNGSTTDWRRSFLGSDPTGQTLRCFGFGFTTLTGGGGAFQQASLTVSSATADTYTLTPNSAGQITWKGDSGGVCLGTLGSIAGVQSGANYSTNPTTGAITAVTSSWQFRASAFASWALRTLGESGVPNDSRANAIEIPLVRNRHLSWVSSSETNEELAVGGTTQGATFDGPSSSCSCYGNAPNVWYRFTLTQREVVYPDTSGSAFDTSLLVTDVNGNPVPGNAGQPVGLCNDDAGCSGAGFSNTLESRTFGILDAGTYYVGVGGCSSGRFTLHLQHVAVASAAAVDEDRMTGDLLVWWNTTTGASVTGGTCTAASGPERMHWYVTCGGQAQLFSTCRSDQGSYVRASGGSLYDTVLYARSAATGKTTACNDDGIYNGATDCSGTGGDTANFGSRLTYTAPRGLNVVYVDNYGPTQGLQYTLRQTVR